MAKVDVLASSVNQRWVTPYYLFETLNKEFDFQWDCAAEKMSAQTVRMGTGENNYFGPDHIKENYRDALSVSWSDTLREEKRYGLRTAVWCNPPYGRGLKEWCKKFYAESERLTVVALVYARTETSWFHEYVWKASEIRFLRGRLTFLHPDTFEEAPAGATAGHMVVVWRPETFGKNLEPKVRLVTYEG